MTPAKLLNLKPDGTSLHCGHPGLIDCGEYLIKELVVACTTGRVTAFDVNGEWFRSDVEGVWFGRIHIPLG